MYAAAAKSPPPPGSRVISLVGCGDSLPVSTINCSMPPAGTKLSSGTVLVTAHLDRTILNFATNPNVTVIAMSNFLGSTITKDWDSHEVLDRPQIAAQRTYWPTAWWIGTKTNNNAASIVYSNFSKIAPGFAPEGWMDECTYRVYSDGLNFVLDELPPNSVDVLVRSVDNTWAGSRSKALVWQAGVVNASDRSAPGGTVLVSGMNLLGNLLPPAELKETNCSGIACVVPESAWMMHSLLQWAYGRPQVEQKLPISPSPTPPSPAPPRGGCPATFPFLDHFRSDICYKTKAEAAAGTGPCDSWCQKGVSPPAGCGQLCPGAGVVRII